eukprot:TRINITY_DN23504_c0_g2_i1.p1 TRINITY_DN23504_c0_g2~~TRINITY_DN23504_c0_g2_i1.p1  ORF type:complete len:986 (+),score=263.28 TRINITY_DN23504_c0_g2_i1:241-3198(+)
MQAAPLLANGRSRQIGGRCARRCSAPVRMRKLVALRSIVVQDVLLAELLPDTPMTRCARKHVHFERWSVGARSFAQARKSVAAKRPARRVEGWRLLGQLFEAASTGSESFSCFEAADALKDTDPQVRHAVCRAVRKALGAIMAREEADADGDVMALPFPAKTALAAALGHCLQDPAYDVRLAAGITLSCLGAAGAVAAKAALLGKGDSTASALFTLSRMGRDGVGVLEEVTASLKESEEELRAAAVKVLGSVCEPRSIETLLTCLKEEQSPLVRLEVVKALQHFSSCCCPAGHRLKPFTTKEVYTCDRCSEQCADGTQMFGCRTCDHDLCKGCAESASQRLVVEGLKDALVADADWAVRRAIVKALPNLGEGGEAATVALADADGDVRHAALELLGKLATEGEGDQHAADVATLLGWRRSDCGEAVTNGGPVDCEPRVRAAAAVALAKMSARDYDAAVEKLLDDEAPETRRWAAWGIGRLSTITPDDALGERAAKLADMVSSDPEADVRKAAIASLGLFGMPAYKHAGQIAKALSADAAAAVRLAAVETLADMGEAAISHLGELVSALKDDCRYVRIAAAKALGDLASHEAAGSCKAEEASTGLARCLAKDRSLGVGVACIRSLQQLGPHGRRHAALLGCLLQGSQCDDQPPPDLYTRKAAADALGQMEEAGAQEAKVLASALKKDPSSTVRYCAAWALGDLGELVASCAGAGASCAAALKDKDPDVRDASARALGAMGTAGEGHAKALAACLLDSASDVRAAAARALRGMRKSVGSYAKDLANMLLNDKSAAVRAAAANALGATAACGVPYVADLKRALSDSDVDVRVAAVNSLGELAENSPAAGAEIAAALAVALADEGELPRVFALEHIGTIGEVALAQLPDVEKALGASSGEVRKAAAGTIGAFGERVGEGSARKLAALLEDRSNEVRAAAATALGSLGKAVAGGFADSLRQLQKECEDDEEVKVAVDDALRRLLDGSGSM